MANLFLYQLIDSSSVKNGSEKSEQLEKADERISHLKAEKNSIPKKEEDSTNSITDTFYGIKNEGTIPTRKIKIITTQTPQEDVLFNPIPLKTQISNWQIITLLFTIVFFGASKAFSSNRFKQTLKALIKYSVAQEINREEKVFFS